MKAIINYYLKHAVRVQCPIYVLEHGVCVQYNKVSVLIKYYTISGVRVYSDPLDKEAI